MKASGPGGRYYRICIFLNKEEKDKLFDAMYKEKTTPAKLFRKALMSYIDNILNGTVGVADVKENEEPIIW